MVAELQFPFRTATMQTPSMQGDVRQSSFAVAPFQMISGGFAGNSFIKVITFALHKVLCGNTQSV